MKDAKVLKEALKVPSFGHAVLLDVSQKILTKTNECSKVFQDSKTATDENVRLRRDIGEMTASLMKLQSVNAEHVTTITTLSKLTNEKKQKLTPAAPRLGTQKTASRNARRQRSTRRRFYGN